MYTQKIFFKNVYRAVGILFAFIGAVFLGISAFFFISSSRFRSHAVPAEGTILYVAHETAIITYEVNGREMTGELGYTTSTMRAGDTVSLYYDPEQPERIETASVQVLSWTFLAAGSLLFGTGLALILWGIRKKALNRRLEESGLRLNGEIVSIEINRRLSSNHRHPYLVICRCRMPDGTIHNVQSGPLWQHPEGLSAGTYVPVYVDERNYKRYYVDLSHLLGEE